MNGKQKNTSEKLLLSALILLLIALLWVFKVPCIFKALFGIECLGCGMTRALVSAAKLDFSAAFSYHKMFWSAPLIAFSFWRDGLVLEPLFHSKWPDRILHSLLFLGFFIAWLMKL